MRPQRNRNAIVYTGGMAIDADGCPFAYHPGGGGLDAIGNAGHPGDYYGVVTDTGEPTGTPIVQGPGDPFPGGWVAQTALVDRTKSRRDPGRYADAQTVPYASIARDLLHAPLELGDVAVVGYRGIWCGAIVAEVGPAHKYGEGSIALADRLAIPPIGKVRGRGVDNGVTWLIFPGSAQTPAWPRTVADFQAQADALFEIFGGPAAVASLIS